MLQMREYGVTLGDTSMRLLLKSALFQPPCWARNVTHPEIWRKHIESTQRVFYSLGDPTIIVGTNYRAVIRMDS